MPMTDDRFTRALALTARLALLALSGVAVSAHPHAAGSAARFPDAVNRIEAVVYADRRFTFADYEREVNRVARGLLELGVQRGDKVALYIPNHPEFVFGYMACAKLGAAAVPVTC